MAPITISMANRCIAEVNVSTVRHAALAVDAQLAGEFCVEVAKVRAELTSKFEAKYTALELHYSYLTDLFQTGHIEMSVLHALHEGVSNLCAVEVQNIREHRAILAMKQHFDEEDIKQKNLVHDLEVREIVLLAIRDELSQRQAGIVDTFLKGIDLTL